MSTAFERAFAHTVGIEGDFSDDPADSGGATRFGITQAVARANGYLGDMRELPLDFARLVYRRMYWTLLRLDDIAALSESLALELFDSAVNCGQAQAAKWLQRSLNALNNGAALWPDLTVDGLIGPMTIDAVRRQLQRPDGEAVLLRALNALQGAFYIELAERRAKDERFIAGWLRRRVGAIA